MITQEGCGPCNIMKSMAPKEVARYNIPIRFVELEPMPENIRPPYTPYFYLMEGDKIIEQWGGDIRKLIKVIERNINQKKESSNE